jgi:disulfide bond formation protein DsbB
VSVDTGTLFLALLAIAAQAAIAVAVVLAVGGRVSAVVARWRSAAVRAIGPDALALAAGVALVATTGSLWLSEGADFVPCKLCWYQRIAMYPLVPLLAIAAWRRDVWIRPYVVTLALIGAAISTWHVLVERFPSLESGTSCDPSNPCSIIWVERFGYLTIPTMAGTAFVLITVLALIAKEPDPS